MESEARRPEPPGEPGAAAGGSASAEPAAPVATAATDLPPFLPSWRLYLYSLASLGLYLLIWIYRTARVLDPAGRRGKHVGWALACVSPPFACLVLFELGRLASARCRRRFRQRDSDLMPALWLALLAVVIWATPLRGLYTAHVALLALPFLTIQARVNGAHRARSERPATQGRWPGWAIALATLAGLAVSTAVYRRVDRADYSFAASLSSQDGRSVSGASGRFTIVPPRSWVRVAPGTVGGKQSDLELTRADRTASIVVYLVPVRGQSLDSVVGQRREIVSANAALTDLAESRFFLTETELEPASVARYQFGRFPQDYQFTILTVVAEDASYEVVTWTHLPTKDADVLVKAIGSFHIVRKRSPEGK